MTRLNPTVFAYLLLLVIASCAKKETAVVETAYGKVEGKVTNTDNVQFYSFLGIPYAKPPVGILRFKEPEIPVGWTGIKKCVNYGPYCIQVSPTNGSVIGSEDCLTLNIFTKNPNTNSSSAVMFWVHGGAHIRGSGAQFGPDFIMEEDVVLVTINYRLGIFGFLTTMDENAYGNFGLKDQISALTWVKENIDRFGGNPNQVTIFGESSGAHSISLLQLSQRSEALFQKIITQSGSALNPRFLQRDPLKYLSNLARYFNIETKNTRNIVDSLRRIDANALVIAANTSSVTMFSECLEALPFYPVIERQNTAAIISKSPYELLQSGDFNKIPFIMGYNTNEGVMGLRLIDSCETLHFECFDGDYTLFTSQSFNNPGEAEAIGKIVRAYFLGNASETPEKLSKFFTQEMYVRGIRKGLDLQRMHQTGFLYRFSYKGTHTTKYSGVAHGEELQYLFNIEGKNENLSSADKITRRRMVKLWTNFAQKGNPTPNGDYLLGNTKWWSSDQNSVNFLDIGEDLKAGSNPDSKDFSFWLEMFEKFGKIPLVTF